MEKARARQIVKERIRAMSSQQCAEKSRAAAKLLLALPELVKAEAVLAYASLPDEIDTIPVMTRLLALGKRLLLPRVVGDALELVEISSLAHDVSIGAYGILEPVSGRTLSPDEIEFAIIPGRGFDTSGARLGRGKGYYDRLLGQDDFAATRCGYCFACQMLDQIPTAENDIPVEIIVTEKGAVRV